MRQPATSKLYVSHVVGLLAAEQADVTCADVERALRWHPKTVAVALLRAYRSSFVARTWRADRYVYELTARGMKRLEWDRLHRPEHWRWFESSRIA